MNKYLMFLLFLISSNVYSQQKRDIAFVENICTTSENHKQWHVAKNNKNGVQSVFSFLFLGYKSFISSQDNNHCGFEPSCSEYAITSLKKHGFVIGVIDACDRLLRCNGLSPEKYEYNEETEQLIDKP